MINNGYINCWCRILIEDKSKKSLYVKKTILIFDLVRHPSAKNTISVLRLHADKDCGSHN